jgi:hypothetical protein
MNGSPLPPQLQPGFRQRLLPTPAGSVPAEYAETLRAFCATVPEIEAAYVCAVENVYDGAEPVQALRFCAQITSPVDTAADSQAVLAAIAPRLAEAHPELMRELGCGVLADRAVPAWQEHALRVYAR